MWRCQLWAENPRVTRIDTFHIDNLYLQLPGAGDRWAKDKMWSRKERSRGHKVRAGREIFAELSKQQKMSRQRPGPVSSDEARRGQPDSHIRPGPGVIMLTQDLSLSSKHSCRSWEGKGKCKVSPYVHIQEAGGASDKEGRGGDRRQESTCAHSTHRCLCHTPGLLLPVLSSVIWPLPVCNFTK